MNEELMRRIEELERRVRDLEARPVYVPVPYYPPYAPLPAYPTPYRAPWESPWVVTCATGGTGVTSTSSPEYPGQGRSADRESDGAS